MHRSSVWSFLALLTACKASISGAPDEETVIDAPSGNPVDIDASVAPPVDAAPLGKWGTPMKITPAASATLSEDDATLSSTALEMIFAVDNGTNGKDLYYTSRQSLTGAWSMPATKLSFDLGTKSEETPR